MKSTIEELATLVNTFRSDRSVVVHHITELDNIDSRFSRRTLQLLSGLEDKQKLHLISILSKWTENRIKFKSALRNVEERHREYRVTTNEVLIILEEVCAARSILTMRNQEESFRYSGSEIALNGDWYLMAAKLMKRPNLMTANDKELNDYYRSVLVAGIVLLVHRDELAFMEQAPTFIMGMISQPNVDDLVAVALKAKTIDLNRIIAIAEMQKETYPALHDGLI